MNKESNKVLFISHNATRTGAPIVLLTLLQYIREQQLFDFDILLLVGGELESEFRELADVSVLHSVPSNGLFSKLFRRISDKEQKERKNYLKKAQAKNYSVIYANTVVTLDIAGAIKSLQPSARLMLHLHEMHYVITEMIGDEAFQSGLNNTDRVIAVSEAVKLDLTANFTTKHTTITTVYEFSVNADVHYQPAVDIRAGLNLRPDTFLVGGAGEVQWRKGYDLFIQTAYCFKKENPDIDCCFVWLGQLYDHQKKQIDYELRKAGLSDCVKFVGLQRNPKDYYAAFDVLAMVSREDPFPLVCIEAAAQLVPVVCFENAGGIPELVEADGGFVVPYMDTVAMSQQIKTLAVDAELRKRTGKAIFEKINNRFSSEKSIRAIVELIQQSFI